MTSGDWIFKKNKNNEASQRGNKTKCWNVGYSLDKSVHHNHTETKQPSLLRFRISFKSYLRKALAGKVWMAAEVAQEPRSDGVSDAKCQIREVGIINIAESQQSETAEFKLLSWFCEL